MKPAAAYTTDVRRTNHSFGGRTRSRGSVYPRKITSGLAQQGEKTRKYNRHLMRSRYVAGTLAVVAASGAAVTLVVAANLLGLGLQFALSLAPEVVAVLHRAIVVPGRLSHDRLGSVITVHPLILVALALLAAIAILRDYRRSKPRLLSHRRDAFTKGLLAAGTFVCVVLVGMMAVGSIAWLITWAQALDFKSINLNLALIMAAIPLVSALRRSVLTRQNWRTLGDPWLKWSGVSALAVGGFGFVGLGTEQEQAVLLKLAVSESQLPPKHLITLYLCFTLIWGIASLLFLTGKAAAASEETRDPLMYFIPAFTLAWLGNLGMYALFFDGLLLTLAGHLAAA
jgi:hypothetical protein